jgi:CHAT domain-containing protein
VERLVIIPDGRLGYLPFQVLIDNRQLEGVDDYRKLPYVINNYEVRYEYSSTLLLAEHTPKQQRGGFLGFAPQYGEGGGGISVRSAAEEDVLAEDAAEVVRLAPLKFTKTEVEEISRLFAGQSNTGELATETAFKTEAPKHNILHLAMHAHTSDKNPMYSRLIFQQGETAGGEDGMLHAYELYNMSLQADLVVLSACETGAGKLQNGEGIMSLSRAFKYAGCPNIVMSLWQADDASTKDIMVHFYRNLKKGMGKSEALRQANRQYLSQASPEKGHPFYWATFVLAGDGEAVRVE